MQRLLLCYLFIVNGLGLLICFVDKRRARRHAWRIPERNIFLVAVIGGSVGVLCGMYLFRHKTLHKKFTIGIPLILICQILLVICLWRSGVPTMIAPLSLRTDVK